MGKPAIKRKYLFVISGLLWSAAGFMLLRFAYTWLITLSESKSISFALIGVTLGALIAVFGLSKIARKNIERIRLLPEKPCLFAFQAWKNYLTIVIMIGMGLFFRTLSFIPKPYLAIVYVAMGTALLFASGSYYFELSPKNCSN